MLRTVIVIVCVLILVFGFAWVVVSIDNPYGTGHHAKTVYKPVYKPVYQPMYQPGVQTTTVLHDDQSKEIKELKNQVNSLKLQVESYKRQATYQQNEKDYYYDYYRDRKYRDDEEYDLKVRVFDDEDDDPIEDARVRVENGDTDIEYTDDDGEVRFRNLEEDCYDIEVDADGYEDEDKRICLDDDERVNFYLRED